MQKYLDLMEKLAKGYDYEEVQTLLRETANGTEKKIVKTKKHVPPNFKAIEYLLKKEKIKEIEKINANRKNKNK